MHVVVNHTNVLVVTKRVIIKILITNLVISWIEEVIKPTEDTSTKVIIIASASFATAKVITCESTASAFAVFATEKIISVSAVFAITKEIEHSSVAFGTTMVIKPAFATFAFTDTATKKGIT